MNSPARSRGTTLLFAIAAVVLIGALAAALVALSLAADRLARRADLDARLLNAAESGAELAIQQLAGGRSRPGARKLPVPGGNCLVSMSKLSPRAWRIGSRASTSSRVCRLTMEVAPAGGGKWRVAAWKASYGNR